MQSLCILGKCSPHNGFNLVGGACTNLRRKGMRPMGRKIRRQGIDDPRRLHQHGSLQRPAFMACSRSQRSSYGGSSNTASASSLHRRPSSRSKALLASSRTPLNAPGALQRYHGQHAQCSLHAHGTVSGAWASNCAMLCTYYPPVTLPTGCRLCRVKHQW